MRYRVIKERCKITSVKTEGARLLEKLLKKKKEKQCLYCDVVLTKYRHSSLPWPQIHAHFSFSTAAELRQVQNTS